MSMKITSFRKLEKGTLYGFCSVKIEAWYMEICDLTVFKKEGSFSFSLPSKEYTKRDGTKGYQSLIKLDDEAYKRFQTALAVVFEEYLKELEANPPALPEQINMDDCPF